MKKLLLTFAAMTIAFSAAADEGMWLLPYLQKMNIKDMKAKGLRLSAEDILGGFMADYKANPDNEPLLRAPKK